MRRTVVVRAFVIAEFGELCLLSGDLVIGLEVVGVDGSFEYDDEFIAFLASFDEQGAEIVLSVFEFL